MVIFEMYGNKNIIFFYRIRKMAESGLMKRIQMTWNGPKPKCMNTPDTSVFSVNIFDFAMALVVLTIGVFISVAILFCEIITVKYYDQKKHIPFRR